MLQIALALKHELVVDNFAGGGGASTGIEAGIGRAIDIAINHDPVALAVHQMNHPETEHHTSDIHEIQPRAVTGDQPVGLAWFSPDCKHFSKAKGGKPVSRRVRSLAWVVVRWAAQVRPRVIMLENVEEFQDWGPVGSDGMPCQKRRGMTFKQWVRQLRRLGYAVEWRQLRACDYGAPTIRKRLFVIARCDGRPIVWPAPTHGPDLIPFRVAAECIHWSIPCPSIFTRRRPLAENTLRRIAHGIRRYVIEAAEPFIVGLAHGTHSTRPGSRVHGLGEPVRTIHAGGGNFALCAPYMVNTRNGERAGQKPRTRSLEAPFWTVTGTGSQQALVAAFLAKHYGGNESPGWPLTRPISTVTTQDHHHLVQAFMIKYYGQGVGQTCSEPMHTLTTKERFGLVTVAGEDYAIADIGMRMLQPRELFRAQGFPDEYRIDGLRPDGKRITKTDQVRLCGNSVCPQIPEALVRANFRHEAAARQGAAA